MSIPILPSHTRHDRSFEGNRFVYPVLSRRSGGVSIGINLNPDKVCNFDCIYCQVDRRSEAETTFVEGERLLAELDAMLGFVGGGELFEHAAFRDTPLALRRLNDLAFSGDGEPTTFRNFDSVVESCARLKAEHARHDVKMVLITNASMFHRPHVQRGLQVLDANQGEVWAKLDAGTEGYFRLVDRTKIPFQRILENITAAAKVRPLVIQSLFMRVEGAAPSEAEQEAFCDRLNEIQAADGKLSLVQLYTIARRPAESFVAPLTDDELDAMVERVRRRTGLAVAAYYGSTRYQTEAPTA